jgi:hypothetical protein
MKIRLIHVSNESGTSEAIYLMEIDNTDAATDYCKPGETVFSDTIITIDKDLSGIPLNYRLQRE